jgi:hypothetical protein
MALKDELDAEDARLQESESDKTSKAKQLEVNQQARRHAYAEMLKSTKTDSEYCGPITAAFKRVCLEETFNKYLLEEIGWTNATSWLNWAIRAAAPNMHDGWAAADAKRVMRAMALKASVSGHRYMERYFLELSIYCAAAQEKAEIGLVFEQASLVFGPLIGPALGVPTKGVWSYVYKGGKPIAEAAASGLAQTLLVSSAELNGTSTEGKKQVLNKKVNLMRFTHAWLKYAISEKTSSDMKIVTTEFGGRPGCINLLEAVAEL